MLNSLGFRYKILLGIAGVVLIMGLMMIVFAETELYARLFAQFEKRAVSISRHLAAECVNSVLTENYVELNVVIRDFMALEEDIAYIVVLTDEGEVLAHTFDKGFPSELKEIHRNSIGKVPSHQTIRTNKGDLIDIAVPMLKGAAGVAHLGFDGKYVRGEVNSVIAMILWMIAGISLIGICVAVLVSQMIARPVLRLATAAEAVGRGDLDQQVEIHSDDEIGSLGKAFNSMIIMRRQAEKALRESEQNLRNVTSNLGEGIYALDELGQITFMNPEAERLIGWTMAELNEKGPHELIHYIRADGSPLSVTECRMHGVIETGETYASDDEVFVRKDGTVFPLSVISAPVLAGGKNIASVTAFRDITRQKATEQEKETLIAELQKALATIKKLHGILPICASCKKIRDDKGYWNQIESYIREHSEAEFSHGMCPDCAKRLYPDYFKE